MVCAGVKSCGVAYEAKSRHPSHTYKRTPQTETEHTGPEGHDSADKNETSALLHAHTVIPVRNLLCSL